MNPKLSLRNLMIAIAFLCAIFAAVEVSLGRLSARDETAYALQKEENSKALSPMAFEKTPYQNIQSSAQLQSAVAQMHYIYLQNPALRDKIQFDRAAMAALPYRGYPLIADLSTEATDAVYDENTVNIVVLGDSFVFGASSANRNELFWRLLETRLRAQGFNVRVRAVAILGATGYEELSWLTDSPLAADLQPDLVLFGYVDNDPDLTRSMQELSRSYDKIDLDERYPFLAALEKLAPQIGKRLTNYIIAKTMYLPGNDWEKAHTDVPILKGETYARYESDFVAPLHALAQRADYAVAVMTLPPYPDRVMEKALYAPLHTLYAQYPAIHFYDSLDTFCSRFAARKHAANYSVNLADDHPGSATHSFYASYIEAFLKKDFAALLGDPEPKNLNSPYAVINEAYPAGAAPTPVSLAAEEAVYTVTYPSFRKLEAGEYAFYGIPFEQYYLTLPLGTDYIKLSFAEPTALSEIRIESDRITNVDLYYCRINEELGYDDHTVLPFGTRTGDEPRWTNATGDRVTSLCIHADCIDDDGADFRLTLRR